jgi:UDP-N-acetyl-D-mannosaminuronic acid transferase (WecB/TagA/CpsF family)
LQDYVAFEQGASFDATHRPAADASTVKVNLRSIYRALDVPARLALVYLQLLFRLGFLDGKEGISTTIL